jgi:hypothetical protein
MDRRGKPIFRGSLPFLVITGCVWIFGASPARAQLADGTWTVQGERTPGSRRCGEWLVRLTNVRGQLSGTVSHARTTVPMQNLVLMPDGTFSGTTEADLRRSRHARASKVTGRFSGDTVNLTLETSPVPLARARPSDERQAAEADEPVATRQGRDLAGFAQMSEQRQVVSVVGSAPGAESVVAPKTFLQKLLDGVETVGNKVPHPAVIFFILSGLVIVLSHLFYLLSTSVNYEVVNPQTHQVEHATATVKSLLSGDGIRFMLTSMVRTSQISAPSASSWWS